MSAENIDDFSILLLEQSKRFLEKASMATNPDSISAFCHASLLLGFSSLEAHMNALSDDLILRPDLGILEQSILKEREFIQDNGRFTLTNKLKMYRLEDRLMFMFVNFSTGVIPKSLPWWNVLQEGIDLRNRLVHPKKDMQLKHVEVAKVVGAILACLDALYKALFGKPHPLFKRGLDSKLTF
jgi:hypothetical protein